VPPGTIEILVVPAVFDSLRVGNLTRLHINAGLKKTVATHLDQYRLLTTTLRIKPPTYIGVKVNAEIIASEFSQPDIVRARVAEALRTFISPLAIAEDPDGYDELMGADWEGWPFERNLYVAEIYSLIQRVPGVKHVIDVQLETREVVPEAEFPPDVEATPDQIQQLASKLEPIEGKLIRVPADTLLCSLDHTVTLVELD
jgi:hypothetical protein